MGEDSWEKGIDEKLLHTLRYTLYLSDMPSDFNKQDLKQLAFVSFHKAWRFIFAVSKREHSSFKDDASRKM